MRSQVIGLGLESSCDETAAAVVVDGRLIRSNVISSQIDIHREYYGVVPEIASRAHLEAINSLIARALGGAGIGFEDLNYVAATNRPGLVGSLLIALQSAKVVSYALGIPLIAVNHLEAHLYAAFLEGRDPSYPFIGLLVSGGNTALYQVHGIGDMELLGKSTDDAAGEVLDKIAKYMNLGYPGGPVIERTARSAVRKDVLFPKILPGSGDFRFSFSGIKTAAINYLKTHPDAEPSEVAYGFQERVLEILVRRTVAAVRGRGTSTIVVAGGVAANSRLRQLLAAELSQGENLVIPSPALCTDNAAMVAGVGYHYFLKGLSDPLSVDVFAKA
jgi:N6-L-threonylcarbamoyladenine synthase